MKNALVTGGAGFIGSHLVDMLLMQNVNVVVLDLLTYAGRLENLVEASISPNYYFIHGNICDSSTVNKILRQYHIDTVFHLAAESHVDNSITNPGKFIETNVVGTYTLLNACLQYWDYIKNSPDFRFIHVSTDEVFGQLNSIDPPFNEKSNYKPMIYYPLSTLILLGITDILIISTPRDTPILESAIGNGDRLGVRITYKIQDEPRGLAEAFLIGEDFIENERVCLMLGDNILHVADLANTFKACTEMQSGAIIVGTPVVDPANFGVIELDEKNNIISLEEKPQHPKSNLAAIGLYFYDNTVIEKAKSLKPSSRGELEITDLNKQYLQEGGLKCQRLSRGATWLDAGVFETLADAGTFIRIVEKRLGLKIGCIEEAAYMMNKINRIELIELANRYGKSPYGEYLHMITSLERG